MAPFRSPYLTSYQNVTSVSPNSSFTAATEEDASNDQVLLSQDESFGSLEHAIAIQYQDDAMSARQRANSNRSSQERHVAWSTHSRANRDQRREKHQKPTAAIQTRRPRTDCHCLSRFCLSRSSLTRLLKSSWALEILALILAAASLALITLLLVIFNNQPLSEYQSDVTLNALINLGSQIGQMALFFPIASSVSQLKWIWSRRYHAVKTIEDFDDASRGFVGLVILVFKYPKWILLYVAAINSILVLLFGSFSQQSVTFPSRMRVIDENGGSLPIVVDYEAPSSVDGTDGYGPEGQKFRDHVGPTMRNAISSGLSSFCISTESDVSGFCTTGNCTFPDVPSLAICSSIKNVTSTLISDCNTADSSQVTCFQGQCPSNVTTCNYTIPALRDAPPWPNNSLSVNNYETLSKPELWVGASFLNDTALLSNVIDIPSPLALVEFYVTYSTGNDPVRSKNISASVFALKCSLFLCVKTYRTAILSGQTNTTVTQVEYELNWVLEPAPEQRIRATDSTGAHFWIGQQSLQDLAGHLSNRVLHGQSVTQPEEGNEAAYSLASALFNAHQSNATKGLEGLLLNLEIAMSNAMRTTSTRPTSNIGRATSFQPYIAVDFRWLILPIAAVAIALHLLVFVAVESRRVGLPVWKESYTRAMLALEPVTHRWMSELDYDEIQKVPVRLNKGEHGWYLQGPKGERWWRKRSRRPAAEAIHDC